MEDGFFVVNGIREADSAEVRPTSLAELRQACLETLRARDPEDPDLGRTPMVVENETYVPLRPARSDAARKLELSKRLSAPTTYHNEQLRRMRPKRPRRMRIAPGASTVVSGDRGRRETAWRLSGL